MTILLTIVITTYVVAALSFYIMMKVGTKAVVTEISEPLLVIAALLWPFFVVSWLYSLIRAKFKK